MARSASREPGQNGMGKAQRRRPFADLFASKLESCAQSMIDGGDTERNPAPFGRQHHQGQRIRPRKREDEAGQAIRNGEQAGRIEKIFILTHGLHATRRHLAFAAGGSASGLFRLARRGRLVRRRGVGIFVRQFREGKRRLFFAPSALSETPSLIIASGATELFENWAIFKNCSAASRWRL